MNHEYPIFFMVVHYVLLRKYIEVDFLIFCHLCPRLILFAREFLSNYNFKCNVTLENYLAEVFCE